MHLASEASSIRINTMWTLNQQTFGPRLPPRKPPLHTCTSHTLDDMDGRFILILSFEAAAIGRRGKLSKFQSSPRISVLISCHRQLGLFPTDTALSFSGFSQISFRKLELNRAIE